MAESTGEFKIPDNLLKSGVAVPALGQILISKGLITEEQLAKAIALQKESGEFLGKIISEQNWVKPAQILSILSEQLTQVAQLQNDSLENIEQEVQIVVQPAAAVLIKLDSAFKANAMPISLNEKKKSLKIGVLNIKDFAALEEIRFQTGLNLEPVEVSQKWLEDCWRQFYKWNGERRTDKQTDDLQSTFKAFTSKLTSEQVGPFLNHLLLKAAELKASDIHIDPFENNVLIRFRIDGKLYQTATFAKDNFSIFIGRLRVMAKIDLSDRKSSYDSRLTIKLSSGVAVDFRISILNAQFGERVVMRLQRTSADIPKLANINMPKVYREMIQQKLAYPHGLMVVTGPTGSGKTTTLYAMLSELSDLSRNVMTIEDPIEFTFPGASQIAVEPERDLTFANILRSVLRQDPDVIMVGEIRDEETAHIAVRAGMTGHLVLCSLHANDALSTIQRLSDMKVAPYQLAPAVNLLMAQRLIRLLCPVCKRPGKYPKELLFDLGFTPQQILNLKFFKPVGCSGCAMTGFKGRLPIFELIDVKQDLRDAIAAGAPLKKLRMIAKKNNYIPFTTLLREYIKVGKTSVEEALPYLTDH